jgi:hypothetical protein
MKRIHYHILKVSKHSILLLCLYIFNFKNTSYIYFRYNGQIPNGDRGRRKSKFQLRQRIQANGLKAQRQHLCQNADEVQVENKIKYNVLQKQSLILNYL